MVLAPASFVVRGKSTLPQNENSRYIAVNTKMNNKLLSKQGLNPEIRHDDQMNYHRNKLVLETVWKMKPNENVMQCDHSP